MRKYWLIIVKSWKNFKAVPFFCDPYHRYSTSPWDRLNTWNVKVIRWASTPYSLMRAHLEGLSSDITVMFLQDPAWGMHWLSLEPRTLMIQNQSLISSETIRKPETYNTYQSVNNRADYTLDRVYLSAHLPKCWWQVNSLFLWRGGCIGALSWYLGTMSSLRFTLM